MGRMITGGGRVKFTQEVLFQYHFSYYKFRVDCPEPKSLPSAVKSWTLLSGRKFWVA
jgi:hypothetical protein